MVSAGDFYLFYFNIRQIEFSDPHGTQVTNMTGVGSIYLTTPNYPLNYPSNTDCVWIFEENSLGTYVIYIIDLETEYWDSLMMGHGYDVGRDSQDVMLSLWYYPKTIVMEERVIWIRFLSNHAVTFRGFLLEIERTETKGKITFAETVESPSTCCSTW